MNMYMHARIAFIVYHLNAKYFLRQTYNVYASLDVCVWQYPLNYWLFLDQVEGPNKEIVLYQSTYNIYYILCHNYTDSVRNARSSATLDEGSSELTSSAWQ